MNKKQIRDLELKLVAANAAYHSTDTLLMSDDEFDAEKRLLNSVKPNNLLTNTVGATVNVGKEIKHNTKMLSLDYRYHFDELTEELKSLDNKRDLIIELKYDGMAGSIWYDNGQFDLAATRGDGEVGENISVNALMVKGVPEKIPFTDHFEVRGEFVLPIKAFEALNGKYVNPRNGLSGLMRRLDADTIKDSGIVFIAYDVNWLAANDFYDKNIDEVSKLGIGTLQNLFPEVYALLSKLNEGYRARALSLQDVYDTILSKRRELPFEIDGLVLKARRYSDRNRLGTNNVWPHWGMAIKFPPASGVTVLEKIDFQISRNGILTPVGKVSPVFIGGVTYTSVTLHNLDEIERLGVYPGDVVMIERRGDVIPKIMKVVSKKQKSNRVAKNWQPLLCPSCKGVLVRPQEGQNLVCVSHFSCPAQRIQQLVHFASRNAMDIVGLAEAVAKEMIDKRLVTYDTDIYSLSEKDLLKIEGFAETSAKNLYNAIQQSKKQPLNRVLFGLGIRDIGETTAKHLAAMSKSLEGLLSFTQDTRFLEDALCLYSLSEIDTVARASIKSFLDNGINVNRVRALIDAGVNPVHKSILESDKLLGQTWVVTGSFDDMNREQVESMLAKNGAKIGSSVSKKTSGLVAGKNAGSKLEKALKHKVPVLSLDDIKQRLA